MKGISLHTHSTFSYMDGYATPEQHVARVVELGMSAAPLTDHGNISSHVQLEKAALAAGVKPIFGLEAYTAPIYMREVGSTRKWHLTILAMNDEGYRNLMKLVTRSWAEGFYQWPTIHNEWFRELNSGLIVLSGCLDSMVSHSLRGGGRWFDDADERRTRRILRTFKSVFGDRFYLECQQLPELPDTCAVNAWLAAESGRLGIPLVGTADVHYPYPADADMQQILHKAGRGWQPSNWEYDGRLTYPDSDLTWLKRLRGTGLTGKQAQAALAATSEVADRCSVELPKAERLRFPVERFGAETAEELVWKWLRDGWSYRSKANKRMRRSQRQQEYVDRIKYEMDVISQKDYLDYFLMLSEAVRWAKDRGIPVGPARGSAAASLVCYMLRITEIDPLPIPSMLFERFIDLNRTDLPDVDLDFADDRREEVRQHIITVYGADHVGNIGTFTKYRGKNSLKDIARAYNIPEWEIEPVKNLVIERSGGDSRADASLADTIEMFPKAKAVFDKHPKLWDATRLEGNYRGMSVHSAGLVISNDPLTDNVAYYTREDKKTGAMRSVLSVDKYDAEYLNLLKADFLGLTTMGMINHALDMIGMSLDDLYVVANPTLHEEPEIIEAFKSGDVVGIFQFGGGATRIVNNDVRPDTFLELCDINALSRPGPLHSGTTDDYINIKHGRREPVHLHPIIDDITQHTKYCIIYQEQILKIIREIGGLPWTHIQEIRKIISLKKGEGAFNERYKDFIEGAARIHGIDEELSDAIWKRLVTAGQYAFNAAHCVSYSMLAWWTMWFKVKHPQAFYAACLRKYEDKEYVLMRDAMRHDIAMEPPSLNDSEANWHINRERKVIVAGLRQVKGIADKTAQVIIRDRSKNGEFESWNDIIRIDGIGPGKVKMITDMINSDDPFGIHKIDEVMEAARQAIRRGEYGNLPDPTYAGAEIPTDAKMLPVIYLGIPSARNPQDVVEDQRARTGRPVEEILAELKRPDLIKKMAVECIDDSDATVYLRFSRFKFPKFERGLWEMELGHDVILVKGIKRGGFGTSIHVSNMWLLNGDDFVK